MISVMTLGRTSERSPLKPDLILMPAKLVKKHDLSVVKLLEL